MIVTLNEEDLEIIDELIDCCQMYYEAIGDDENPEIGHCHYLREKFGLTGKVQEENTCNNEIWW